MPFRVLTTFIQSARATRPISPEYLQLPPNTASSTYTTRKYTSSWLLGTTSTPQPMHSPNSLDIMSASTPSPPISASISNSTSRRPPRKSTLTQQQKNQKRQRATQDQLGTLEIEFNKNATPAAAIRERIAQDINMTERSVQIWFQNR